MTYCWEKKTVLCVEFKKKQKKKTLFALPYHLKPLKSQKSLLTEVTFPLSIPKMALVQSRILPQLNVPLSPILSTLHAPSSIFLRREIRPGTSPLSSSTDRNLPFSPLTHPRKLLCPPPRGKFVREDYLVVRSISGHCLSYGFIDFVVSCSFSFLRL